MNIVYDPSTKTFTFTSCGVAGTEGRALKEDYLDYFTYCKKRRPLDLSKLTCPVSAVMDEGKVIKMGAASSTYAWWSSFYKEISEIISGLLGIFDAEDVVESGREDLSAYFVRAYVIKEGAKRLKMIAGLSSGASPTLSLYIAPLCAIKFIAPEQMTPLMHHVFNIWDAGLLPRAWIGELDDGCMYVDCSLDWYSAEEQKMIQACSQQGASGSIKRMKEEARRLVDQQRSHPGYRDADPIDGSYLSYWQSLCDHADQRVAFVAYMKKMFAPLSGESEQHLLLVTSFFCTF